MHIATMISAGSPGVLLGWLMIRWRTRGKHGLWLGATLVMIALAAALSAIQWPLGLVVVFGCLVGGSITGQQMGSSTRPGRIGQGRTPGSRPSR